MSNDAPRSAISVRDLGVAFRVAAGILPVVDSASFEVVPGRVLGIAGESGSGKTTACLAAIGYYRASDAIRVSGKVELDGVSLLELDMAALRQVWAHKISYVAQDAARALNPARRIGSQICEILRVDLGLDSRAARQRALSLLDSVRLGQGAAALEKYPHEFSGGQLQRIAIAMALACEPRVILFDEPTTGLDVTTQAEVTEMLSALVRERQIAGIYVSHDIGVLCTVADELAIMYAGQIVERGPVATVVSAPRHPYSRALLDSLLSVQVPRRPVVLPGLPPGRVLPDTCSFAARCRFVEALCRMATPALELVAPAHDVRCRRTHELGVLPAKSIPVGAEDGTPPDGLLLKVRNLICEYGARSHRWRAVDQASLEIRSGEVVALVGESGSGKSTIARTIAGILSPRAGAIELDGRPLPPTIGRRRRETLRDIQYIFQNPDSSLNPRHTVESLIGRSVTLFRPDVAKSERRDVVHQMLREVRLDPAVASRYPHALSGGQRQRVAIARAFVAQPRLVLCDEIVSGQDVSVQAAILELLRSMQHLHNTALLFISHDLAVVRSISQRVYVMEKGRIKEEGDVADVLGAPHDAYTQRLLSAVRTFERGIEF